MKSRPTHRGRFVLLAVLALVVAMCSSATAGALITGKQIKNGSVTGRDLRDGTVSGADVRDASLRSADVQDGSLSSVDLVREQPFTYVGEPGGPVLRDGGEGDCVWTDASATLDGLAPVGYRIDRFDTVHLSGVASAAAEPGAGDGSCADGDDDEVAEDRIALVLPRRYWPSTTVLVGLGDGILVVGPQGLTSPNLTLPAGAVYCETVCALHGLSYPRIGSTIAHTRRTTTSTTGAAPERLLAELDLR